MLLAEDLLLLLTDDDTGKRVVGSTEADAGLAGAVMVELTLAGRLDVTPPGRSGRLVVTDPTPLGDPLLDQALERLRGQAGKKPGKGIDAVKKDLQGALYDRLAERGALRVDRGKVLGIFPTTRWPEADGRHEDEVRAALHQALVVGVEPEPWIGSLAALLHAVGAVDKALGLDRADRAVAKQRAKELADGTWAAGSVRAAIDAVNGAVTTAVMVATTGAAAGS